MWSAINSWLNLAFDVLLLPLHGTPTSFQVIILAVPTAVLALLAYRFTSNQAGIATAKQKIAAYLLELRLYGDDLRVMFAAQGQVFWHIFVYMAHALRPMAVMMLPILLIMIQVESRYAFRSFEPGEQRLSSQ